MKRLWLILAVLVAGAAQAEVHSVTPYQDGEPIPEGYGAVLMGFKASGFLEKICGVTLSDRLQANTYEYTAHLGFGGPSQGSNILFLVPEGQYFFKLTQATLQSLTSDTHGESDANHQNVDIHDRKMYFEVLEGTINYIGEWDMGPDIDVEIRQPPKLDLAYPQEPIVAAFNANPQLFNSAPIAVSELRKRARKLGK